MMSGIEFAEKGFVPDVALRMGIRSLLRTRLRECAVDSEESAWDVMTEFYNSMDKAPLALNTSEANEQHYEVPTEFYDLCLGARKKYSSCYFPKGSETLDQAEEIMLAKTCERAGLTDGMKILELGCGWGSLSLWMAQKYPAADITVVSNSRTQREYIEGVAAKNGFKNLKVITCDMNRFEIDQKFDRVVSVEMFEHMRNWRLLFERVSGWLKQDGKLFFHIFTHRFYTYPFETEGEDNWMGRHFFTGGIMPSFDLPLRYQDHLRIENQWLVNGNHYGETAEWWLRNLDANRSKALEIFNKAKHPSGDSPEVLVNRWRIFFLACAELWNFRGGNEWCVGHYLFSKR